MIFMDYNFESNSNNSKKNTENKERMTPVVDEGVASVKKKNFAQKFLKFVMDDDVEDVGDYLKNQVLRPYVKKFLYDLITGSAGSLIYRNKPSAGYSDSYMMTYNDYTRAYGNSTAQPYYSDSPDSKALDHSTDINFHNRDDLAYKALHELEGRLAHYRMVSVLDLYDVSNLGKYTNPNDDCYGWTDLRNAKVVNIRGDWYLKMPPAFPLD